MAMSMAGAVLLRALPRRAGAAAGPALRPREPSSLSTPPCAARLSALPGHGRTRGRESESGAEAAPQLSVGLGGRHAVASRPCVHTRPHSQSSRPEGLRRRQFVAAAGGVRGVAAPHASSLQIELVPCLRDNYAYLLLDPSSPAAALVDPSEAEPLEAALRARGLPASHVLATHHHADHTGGIARLKARYGLQVVGPKADQNRIPCIDVALGEGDIWQFGGHSMQVFDTPGHTRGHVSFYFPSASAVFTGDTLFALGCGRLFEGTPEQMWASLSKLTALPPATLVYCGHEYTQANAEFALSVEGSSAALRQRVERIRHLRGRGLPTIPSTLEEELATNPFLRPHSAEIRRALGMASDATDVQVFAALRRAKDEF